MMITAPQEDSMETKFKMKFFWSIEEAERETLTDWTDM